MLKNWVYVEIVTLYLEVAETPIHWYLLNFMVIWHRFWCVSLVFEPGDKSLQGTIGTSPAVVVSPVLHVVVICVGAIHQVNAATFHWNINAAI